MYALMGRCPRQLEVYRRQRVLLAKQGHGPRLVIRLAATALQEHTRLFLELAPKISANSVQRASGL